MIRQTCLSPRFGMIGQQTHTPDKAFPFINRRYTKSQAPCKGNATSVFSLRASRELPQNRHLPPKMGGISHRRCQAAGSRRNMGRLRAAIGSGSGAGRPASGLPQVGALMIYLQTVPSVTLKEAKSPLDCP